MDNQTAIYYGCIGFMIGVGVVMGIILLLMYDDTSYPTIQFVKQMDDDDLNGYYDGFRNKMTLAAEGQYPYYTFIHEYAHWIYLKRLNKTEKRDWDDKLCNKTYPAYDALYDSEREKCSEHFAISMSQYVLQEGWHYKMLRDMNHTQDVFYYVADVYEKYW